MKRDIYSNVVAKPVVLQRAELEGAEMRELLDQEFPMVSGGVDATIAIGTVHTTCSRETRQCRNDGSSTGD